MSRLLGQSPFVMILCDASGGASCYVSIAGENRRDFPDSSVLEALRLEPSAMSSRPFGRRRVFSSHAKKRAPYKLFLKRSPGENIGFPTGTRF